MINKHDYSLQCWVELSWYFPDNANGLKPNQNFGITEAVPSQFMNSTLSCLISSFLQIKKYCLVNPKLSTSWDMERLQLRHLTQRQTNQRSPLRNCQLTNQLCWRGLRHFLFCQPLHFKIISLSKRAKHIWKLKNNQKSADSLKDCWITVQVIYFDQQAFCHQCLSEASQWMKVTKRLELS